MKRKKFSLIIFSILSLLTVLIIAVLLNVITLDELPSSFIGAVLGAAITGVITLILLEGQTESQEVKERNVCVFSKRSEIFQEYIKDVWKIWEEQKITSENFKNLTLGYYRDLMLYLDDEKKYGNDKKIPSEIIANCLSEIGDCLDKDDYDTYEKLRKNVTLISNVLSDQIELGGTIKENIIAKHDEQMWPIYFRRELLDAFNKMPQVVDGTLVDGHWTQGKSRIMKGEARYIHEAISYKFTKYPAYTFKYTISLNTKYGGKEGFGQKLYIPKGGFYKSFDRFRHDNGKSELIILSGYVENLFTYITEDDNLKIPSFTFLDHPNFKQEKENLNKIRKEYQMAEIAETLADRASKAFENLKIDDLPILEFLEKYSNKTV